MTVGGPVLEPTSGIANEERGSATRTVHVGRSRSTGRETQVGSIVQGTVKFFDNDRGFGFISRQGGEDVFVHVSNLAVAGTSLSEGQAVEFEVGPGRKSEEAKNIRAL